MTTDERVETWMVYVTKGDPWDPSCPKVCGTRWTRSMYRRYKDACMRMTSAHQPNVWRKDGSSPAFAGFDLDSQRDGHARSRTPARRTSHASRATARGTTYVSVRPSRAHARYLSGPFALGAFGVGSFFVIYGRFRHLAPEPRRTDQHADGAGHLGQRTSAIRTHGISSHGKSQRRMGGDVPLVQPRTTHAHHTLRQLGCVTYPSTAHDPVRAPARARARPLHLPSSFVSIVRRACRTLLRLVRTCGGLVAK